MSVARAGAPASISVMMMSGDANSDAAARWRPDEPAVVGEGEVGRAVEQELEPLAEAVVHGEVRRRLAALGRPRVHAGARLEQRLHAAEVELAHREVERRRALVVRRVGVGAAVEERAELLLVRGGDGVEDRRGAHVCSELRGVC